MDLELQINQDIKDAMRAQDKEKLDSLRAVKAAILLEKTKEGGSGTLSEETQMQLLNRLIKQRKEAADIYKTQNADALYHKEMLQAEHIQVYLPKALSAEELEMAIISIIQETGAQSAKDMGKVMGIASKKLLGKAEGKAIADMVKKCLS